MRAMCNVQSEYVQKQIPLLERLKKTAPAAANRTVSGSAAVSSSSSSSSSGAGVGTGASCVEKLCAFVNNNSCFVEMLQEKLDMLIDDLDEVMAEKLSWAFGEAKNRFEDQAREAKGAGMFLAVTCDGFCHNLFSVVFVYLVQLFNDCNFHF